MTDKPPTSPADKPARPQPPRTLVLELTPSGWLIAPAPTLLASLQAARAALRGVA